MQLFFLRINIFFYVVEVSVSHALLSKKNQEIYKFDKTFPFIFFLPKMNIINLVGRACHSLGIFILSIEDMQKCLPS